VGEWLRPSSASAASSGFQLFMPQPYRQKRRVAAGSGMNKSNLPGLSPLWLISLAMVLGTTIVVMIPAAISGGDAIKANDWIAFAGNVLAGVMTLIAAVIAWFAVQRQIRAQAESEARRTTIDLISREEERMEALLPGLESAFNFLITVQNALIIQGNFDAYRTALNGLGLWLDDMNDMQAKIDKRLPTTDASTRLEIARTLGLLVSGTSEYQRAMHHMLDPDLVDRTPEETSATQWSLKAATNTVQSARDAFDRLLLAIHERANLFRERMPKFRTRIEASFGKD
jgi:hypothetical protein